MKKRKKPNIILKQILRKKRKNRALAQARSALITPPTLKSFAKRSGAKLKGVTRER